MLSHTTYRFSHNSYHYSSLFWISYKILKDYSIFLVVEIENSN